MSSSFIRSRHSSANSDFDSCVSFDSAIDIQTPPLQNSHLQNIGKGKQDAKRNSEIILKVKDSSRCATITSSGSIEQHIKKDTCKDDSFTECVGDLNATAKPTKAEKNVGAKNDLEEIGHELGDQNTTASREVRELLLNTLI